MKIHTLQPAEGSTRSTKRLGRGTGSGLGKTSGKGHKGQRARSGGGVRPGFEGGQMPLTRRVPKRGFNNIFKKEFVIINIGDLNVFEDGSVVTLDSIIEKNITKIKQCTHGLKVLGGGELTKKLTVQAIKFTESAKQSIEKAGGKAEVL